MITFWVSVLAITILAYVLLDGFDLGVGLLFGFATETDKRQMLSTVSPVWDGNETWLVITGAILFGAFPTAYAALLSAFYLPLLLMLVGLILRGVAFEFRYKAHRSRGFWDMAFWGGSFAATFSQGLMVGALVAGVPMEGSHFAGGSFFWLSFFPCLCGVGLCAGNALLGACWLAGKSDGVLLRRMRLFIPPLIIGVIVFLVAAFWYSVNDHLQTMHRWFERPYLVLFPIAGVLSGGALVVALGNHRASFLYPCAAIVFASAFGTLAVSFWPYIIPFALTVNQAAAPSSSLRFMFWGAGLFVIPITFVYTFFTYRVFRGKTLNVDDVI